MRVALTIAGFDPSSGAGITADLAVFAAHALYGTACLTATTVQSTRGVRSVHPTSPALLRSTLDELCADLPPDGIKIGMLASAEILEAVCDFLEELRTRRTVPIVLDPVLRSSSGHALLPAEALHGLRRRLLPLISCVTPNVAELEVLSDTVLSSEQEIGRAARALQTRHGSQRSNQADLALIVTGGDTQQPDDLIMTTDGRSTWLRGTRVDTTSTHGTGCAFSSALLANLVAGSALADAARGAKDYVAEALRRAPGIGHGKGPLDLFWPLRTETKQS